MVLNGITLIGIIIILFIMSIYSSDTKSSNFQSVTTSSESKLPSSSWVYNQKEDDMGKGTTYHAWVQSSNAVNFNFPYSGEQHGLLILRTHPRHGKDIIFKIEKGQILCRSYDNCTVLVRFDDENPIKFKAVEAADNSTNTIFINNYSRFVEKMLKAKRIRISANIYQEGNPMFEFNVSNFEQSKYKPKK